MSDHARTLLLHGGRILRADGTFAEAMAIRGGVVAAVGTDDDLAGQRADETVDLGGRLVVPGFVDAHAHPVQGGLELGQCDLTGLLTLPAVRQRIADYATAHRDLPWITGGGWSMESFPDGRPTAALLDAVVGDRPASLVNRDHHSSWVSTAALQAAGVDAGTRDPADGRIERDPGGTPTGLLHEGAMALVDRLLPVASDDDYVQALRVAQTYLHSLGIVGWQDAIVHLDGPDSGIHRAYLTADRDGWLTARVAGALWWDRECTADGVSAQVAALAAERDAVATHARRYRVDTIKIMQDGIAETFTAGLIEPYLGLDGQPTGNRGLSFVPPALLTRVVRELDAAGFPVHFHALGDRAVREALDALSDVAPSGRGSDPGSSGGGSDLGSSGRGSDLGSSGRGLGLGAAGRRHQLAHLQVVHPDDIPRFRMLGAIANLQPLWACHEPQMDELTIPFLGAERARWQYPFAGLAAAGARLAMGSDWPVSSPDPILGVHTAVNRIAPRAPAGTPPLEAGQRLDLVTALMAYTEGSRLAAGFGSALAEGADADLVVLDRDLFALPPEEIHTARVQRTYVGGRLVYDAG
jgi:predicted amidohydrolase YtcJ